MHPHRNNIGFLRLVLASLVIFGHAPEMMDGDRSREPLTRLFHTLSLGEVAVDGFFLLSGYLIAGSMMRTRSIGTYLERRFLRIFPAFAAASLICVFFLGPIVHADVASHLPDTLLHIALLQPPMSYPGQFPGMHAYAVLNGSMWTIAYEFRCYLLLAALYFFGVLGNRTFILVFTIALTVVAILASFHFFRWRLDVMGDNDYLVLLAGKPAEACRLTSTFMIGACFYTFWREIDAWLTALAGISCAMIAMGLMYHNPHFAGASATTFGAVSLFYVACKANLGPLQRVNDAWDVSYGVYLYGWPIATCIRWLLPSISPWLLASLTLPCAFSFGAASWWGLEKRIKDLVRSRPAQAFTTDHTRAPSEGSSAGIEFDPLHRDTVMNEKYPAPAATR